MRTSLKPANIFFICAALLYASCKKAAPASADGIDPNKTYTGILLATDCPRYGFIQVINADIGDDWVYHATTYHHTLAIANLPDSVKSAQVSFTLDTAQNYQKCVPARICPQIVLISPYPKLIRCANSFKSN